MALQQRDEQGRAAYEQASSTAGDPQEIAFGPALRQEHRRVGQPEMFFAQGEQTLFRGAGLCELLLDEAPLVLYAEERIFELPGLAAFEGALVLAVDERGQHFVDVFHHILVGHVGDLQLHGPLRGSAHDAGIVDDARVVLHLHHDEHEQPDAEQEDGYDGGDFRSQGQRLSRRYEIRHAWYHDIPCFSRNKPGGGRSPRPAMRPCPPAFFASFSAPRLHVDCLRAALALRMGRKP